MFWYLIANFVDLLEDMLWNKQNVAIVLTGRGDKEAYPPRSEIPEGHHWGLPGWDHGEEEPEAWGPQGPEGAGHQVRWAENQSVNGLAVHTEVLRS